MSFKPYFETVNNCNFDTYKSVSSLPLPDFSNYGSYYSSYSMPLFGASAGYSYMPSFLPGNNIWSANTYDFGYTPSYSLDFSGGTKSYSNAYDFGSLTSGYSPLSSVSAYKASGKTSYKSVSGAAKQKLGPEFLARVKEVAQNINCDYKDLLAVMNSESGLDSTIQNSAGYQAYGLIQFTPDTARDLGTSVQQLVKMSPVEQLDYVEKFYLKARKTRGFGDKKFTAADLYAITFLPARANRNVLCVKGERWESGRKKGQLKNWYEANTVFDKNKDGKIEKAELQEQMNACRVNENIFMA